MGKTIALGALSALGILLLGAAPTQGSGVHLRGGEVPQGLSIDQNALRGAGQGVFIVRTSGDPALLKRGLEARGGRVLTYLPERAFLVSMPGERLASAFKPLAIDFVGPWSPSLKLAPEVGEGYFGPLMIHLLPGADIAPLKQALGSAGATLATSERPTFPRIALKSARGLDLAALAQNPDVFFIEARGEVRLLNAQAVSILQSGENDGMAPIHERGLLGQNQLVGYLDTGLDFDSCFFRDPAGIDPVINTGLDQNVGTEHRKVHAYNMLWSADDPNDNGDFDNHGHGTHVGGNIGGDALLPPEAGQNGLAPEARFVVQDGGYGGVDNCADLPALGCPVVDLVPIFEQAYGQGARIHNNSWGDNENSSAQWTYSAGSQDVDEVVRDNRDMLIIFAAGNSGPGAGSVGSPSTGKNVLAVGGSGNGSSLERLVTFTSRGPTADGRLKPEVMAPASNTSAGTDRDVSTDNCGLDTGAGTSYAAPLVAGAAALARQYYEEGYYPSGEAILRDSLTPSAALLKASLIASARAMTMVSPIPSMDQGFGRVALSDVLSFSDSPFDLKIVDGGTEFTSSRDAAYTLDFTIRSSSEPLKVVLTWTDPPSSPAAATNLINDLDLTLESGRLTFKGNVMRRGRSVPGGSADRLNNTEVIYIPSPQPGRYSLKVSPNLIPEGPQDFALVIRGALEN